MTGGTRPSVRRRKGENGLLRCWAEGLVGWPIAGRKKGRGKGKRVARLGCCRPTREEARRAGLAGWASQSWGRRGRRAAATGWARGREYTDFIFYFLIPINVTIYIPISIIAR
jgi:hypothetical protein